MTKATALVSIMELLYKIGGTLLLCVVCVCVLCVCVGVCVLCMCVWRVHVLVGTDSEQLPVRGSTADR